MWYFATMQPAPASTDRAAMDAELRRRFLVPAIGILAFAFFAAVAAVLWSAHRQDQTAADQTRAVVGALVEQQRAELERYALDYSWWDTAVEKLVRSPDPAWADDNIGWYMRDLAGIDFSLVLSPDNSPLYRAINGERSLDLPLVGNTALLKGGLEEVRALDPAAPGGVARFVRANDDVFLVGLGAITPEKAASPEINESRGVLILGRRIDTALMQSLGTSFAIDELMIHKTGGGDLDNSWPLLDFSGAAIAHLTWQPPKPGTQWAAMAIPGLAALIFVIAMLAVLVFRVWRETLDRLFAQEMLLRAAKDEAEAASRAKTAFLANVSHELRTPLNAIIGFSSIMKDQMLGPIGSPKYRDYAKDILGTARHLGAIIGEILDLSSIESSRQTLDLSNFPIGDIVAEAVRFGRAEFANVQIDDPVTSRLDLLVRADRSKILQIVTNLITNAAKASGPGGRVQILHAATADRRYRICVMDSGAGVDPEAARSLFTPFARGTNPYQNNAPGYGIGLAVSKRLADLHGATLTLQPNLSPPGSMAELILPAERVLTSTTAAAAS